MQIRSLDHLVLNARDVGVIIAFYSRVLGMEPREEMPGKWSLHFGDNKISLNDANNAPAIARGSVPGSGNYCILTDVPMDEVVEHLQAHDVAIEAGPGKRIGATGPIMSVYFRDPDGNLIELSNPI
ncbi:MAG: VOC family protein [Minwuia sp.]|nr:VOC family protein [Minwuia sp.]